MIMSMKLRMYTIYLLTFAIARTNYYYSMNIQLPRPQDSYVAGGVMHPTVLYNNNYYGILIFLEVNKQLVGILSLPTHYLLTGR